MNKFILICFAVMAIGFYELSGGSDFDPEKARQAALDARVARSAKEQDAVSMVPEAKASQVTEVAISENPAEDEPVTASARPEPAPEPVNLDLASLKTIVLLL